MGNPLANHLSSPPRVAPKMASRKSAPEFHLRAPLNGYFKIAGICFLHKMSFVLLEADKRGGGKLTSTVPSGGVAVVVSLHGEGTKVSL
jgi:hypothetical protein